MLKYEKINPELLPWIMWLPLMLSFVVSLFHRVSLSVIVDRLIIDLSIRHATQVGALVSVYAFIYMMMQLPSGLLADCWGPRRTVTTGMFIASTGTLIFSASPNLAMAFVGRGLIGLGVSVIFVSVLKFQVSWFRPNQTATLLGLTLFAGNLGSVIGMSPLAYMVELWNWRTIYIFIGFATFLITAACWLLIRDNPQNRILSGTNWADKNNNKRSGQQALAQTPGLWLSLKNVIKNHQTWILFLCCFGLAGTLLAFTGTWSVPYLMQVYGFTRIEAANVIQTAFFAKILGFPLVGFFSDKLIRRRPPIIFLFILYTLLWGLLAFWGWGKPPVASLYPVFFLMGFCESALVVVPSLAMEVNSPAHSALAASIVNMGPFAGMAIFQPLYGFLLDLRWNGILAVGVKVYSVDAYRLIFVLNFIVLIICTMIVFRVKETNCQNIYLHSITCPSE